MMIVCSIKSAIASFQLDWEELAPPFVRLFSSGRIRSRRPLSLHPWEPAGTMHKGPAMKLLPSLPVPLKYAVLALALALAFTLALAPAAPGADEPALPEALKPYQEFVKQAEKYNGLIHATPTDEKPYVEDFKPTDKPAWAVVDTPEGYKADLRKEGEKNVLEFEVPGGLGGMIYVGKEVSGPFAIEVEARAESPQPCDLSIFLNKPGSGPGFQFGGMMNTINRLWTERPMEPGQNLRPGLIKDLPTDVLIKPGQWHTVRMEVRDGVVSGAVDGKMLGEMRLGAKYDWTAKNKPLIYCFGTKILIAKVTIFPLRPRTAEEKAKALGEAFGKMTREQVDQKIDALIKLMDADEWAVREAAQKMLGEVGTIAQPALKMAAETGPDEVKARAAKLLTSEGQPQPDLPN
jgi:hypothetical protein